MIADVVVMGDILIHKGVDNLGRLTPEQALQMLADPERVKKYE